MSKENDQDWKVSDSNNYGTPLIFPFPIPGLVPCLTGWTKYQLKNETPRTTNTALKEAEMGEYAP